MVKLTGVYVEYRDIFDPTNISLKLMVVRPIKNGKLHGACIYFDGSGLNSELIEYNNGVRKGMHYVGFYNGIWLKQYRYDENGNLDGIQRVYSKDGKLESESLYKHGKLIRETVSKPIPKKYRR